MLTRANKKYPEISHLWQDERDAGVDPLGLVSELADADQLQQVSLQLVDLKKFEKNDQIKKTLNGSVPSSLEFISAPRSQGELQWIIKGKFGNG